jgi:hypothetical protein
MTRNCWHDRPRRNIPAPSDRNSRRTRSSGNRSGDYDNSRRSMKSPWDRSGCIPRRCTSYRFRRCCRRYRNGQNLTEDPCRYRNTGSALPGIPGLCRCRQCRPDRSGRCSRRHRSSLHLTARSCTGHRRAADRILPDSRSGYRTGCHPLPLTRNNPFLHHRHCRRLRSFRGHDG